MARPKKKPPAPYRSWLEYRVCNNLRNRGIEFDYEPYKIKYDKVVKGALCANCGSNVALKPAEYTPDVVLSNGVHVEVKGKFTGEMRTKMIQIKESNPDLDIRLLFQRDNWITKKKATRYSEWAEKHGFPWVVGETIPSSWVE